MFKALSAQRWIGAALLGLLLGLLAGCGGAVAPAPTAGPAARQPELPLLNEAIDTVTQVAVATGWTPLDAVPAPDGQQVYFTANGTAGPGVYRVGPSGGAVTTVASGAPLSAPWGLAISSDGQTLYVADLGAEGSADGNVIFAVPASGGTPTPLGATAGSRPNVPEVVREAGADVLYYSGFDPSDEQPAIFKLNPAAAQPTVLFKGAPLAWPSGIAVTKEGVVYVADLAAAGQNLGAVFRIQGGAADELAGQLRTSGGIAGATLMLDESALLVSNLHREQGTAQVLVVNLATGELGLINKGIGGNTGAGGLHRAHGLNQFAWADYVSPRPPRPPFRQGAPASSTDGGGVYSLTTP